MEKAPKAQQLLLTAVTGPGKPPPVFPHGEQETSMDPIGKMRQEWPKTDDRLLPHSISNYSSMLMVLTNQNALLED